MRQVSVSGKELIGAKVTGYADHPYLGGGFWTIQLKLRNGDYAELDSVIHRVNMLKKAGEVSAIIVK